MKRHNNFGYLVGEGFRAVFKHGFMSFAAICITVACLVIINSFALIAYNMDLMVEDVQKQMRVVVAIDETYSHAEAKSVGSRINLIPNVENAEYLSREDALKNFASDFDDSLFDGLDASSMRDQFIITLVWRPFTPTRILPNPSQRSAMCCTLPRSRSRRCCSSCR